MKSLKLDKGLAIFCICIFIFINNGKNIFVKGKSHLNISKCRCCPKFFNKYMNLMININNGEKKKRYKNGLIEAHSNYENSYNNNQISMSNKFIRRHTNRLLMVDPNKLTNNTPLKSNNNIQKHMRAKYNLGNANYRIQKELHNFLKNPPINCTLDVHPNNIRIWIVKYVGLENTIYANEAYKIKIIFPNDYPLKPPIVYFLQKPPKHTHVYSNGDICLSLLGNDYNPSLSISGLVLSIISMLSSAKEKKLPIDNYTHADAKPGSSQNNFLYHDDKC
ncbi:ubiquitin-conjugating enzyme E2, putative [Plasmodium berghei]|uniref:Ubiquitin-conjugating enzyme E2, putative n=2 Tax=Plasmodium berghei TaxID=5821 RepID=A0A509ARI2_PLABA|nr:ubiquitin-conjugating enzyme E2, putative [Plasmodium berghei ANKA]CXJ03983.1 ubiquitin-conjugating enzyme E2, putative [Plasmodium berghei]SCL98578.1 ubiquitin-conjugating enzyme E2, putative [Plasmodium berghei]SCM16857.1 ubiquitin-conjugating enzyme E2, putative [Plasmodium berghei]SCM18655.1 ubiquitin-conjugating enzyme E2, putative [Plasmodium berghei]SCN28090.1 ubiquitin-conjugating enzyme E2, putative [Plasmodium berghei]|eukprot:XP_034423740.1 ubiquitin-conjugating enzyme E2, putative [Plasmodium berghei ANKA]